MASASSRLGARIGKLSKVPMGVAMLAFLLLLLFQGSPELIAGIALVGIAAAAWELSMMQGRNAAQRVSTIVGVVAAALLSRWLLADSRAAVSEFLLLALMVWIVAAPLALIRPVRANPTLIMVLGCFMLVAAWLAVAVLAEYDRWMLIVGIFAVVVADTCAWFVGRNFGKLPLAPRISPSKTWEGVLGALFALFLMALIIWAVYLQDSYPHWLLLLVAGATCALAVLGDLVESSLKRSSGMKDSSSLLGSHGGVLDRVDSWLPVLPFLALVSGFFT